MCSQVPEEPKVLERRAKVLALFRDQVPRMPRGSVICAMHARSYSKVYSFTDSRGGRGPEYHEVIHPFENECDLVCTRISMQVSAGAPWIPPTEERPSMALCCM